MNFIRLLFILTLSAPLITSCGDDDDDNDSGQREEAPGGTGGTSGGGATGGGGGSSCLSTTTRQNIRSFLDRAAGLVSVQGTAFATEINSDGTITNFTGLGGYTLSKEGKDSWRAGGGFCDVDNNCFSSEWRGQIRADGCFYSDGNRARIVSTSNSRISFNTTNSDRDRVQSSFAISSDDKLSVVEAVIRDGLTIFNFRFEPL